MKLVMLMSILVCVAVAALAATVPHYIFSSAGNYPGAFETDPNGANLSQIVGYYVPRGGSFVSAGYIETVKGFVTAQPAGSANSYLFSINSGGIAVGGYCEGSTCDGAPFGAHGYTYDSSTGATTTINYPGSQSTVAYGISDAGVIVGGFCPTRPLCPIGLALTSDHGFIDDNGVFTQLDFPGATETTAFGINNTGTVVGIYTNGVIQHGFIYQNGVYTDINFPGANWSEATGVNDLGVVVGHFQDASFNVNGFMYYKGQFAQINVQPGHTTAIWGINRRNDLVGTWLGARGQSDTFKAIPTR